ncbi:hypothetical protein [Thiocapsa sp. UBA6158]|uniref:hypothetical protein n=1 Tax=Thiocapsa sp. UBA6158 TaxID=1947692 RepID=UPI0025DF7591|nr:hypothetical protein [Thiocapsa sp. UBA6158]
MMISATMDLDHLAERMGDTATPSEARVMRHMLAETLEGIETAEIDPDQWSSLVELAIQRHRELVGVLGSLCTRNEAGQHFTETADPDDLDQLESLDLLLIHRPTHEATGIPYSSEYWTLEVTEAGIEAVECAEGTA